MSIDPLHKTLESLKQIQSALLPFLRLLKDDDDNRDRRPNHHSKSDSTSASKTNGSAKKKRSRPDDDKDNEQSIAAPLTSHRRAEAEAAVALAIGTLRYMGARLRGLDRGRKKGDPLRMELDKIRGMLVALRKLESDDAVEDDGKKESSKKTDGKDIQEIKRKSVDAITKKTSKNSAPRREGMKIKGEVTKSSNKKQRR